MLVARQADAHAGKGAQRGDVVQRVVGGAQCTVGHAAAHTEYGHGIAAVGQVYLHLLQTAGHVETGGTAAEHFLARMGQSGGDAHGILLRNAALHKLGGEGGGEIAQGNGTAGVGGHGYDVAVGTGQLK